MSYPGQQPPPPHYGSPAQGYQQPPPPGYGAPPPTAGGYGGYSAPPPHQGYGTPHQQHQQAYGYQQQGGMYS